MILRIPVVTDIFRNARNFLSCIKIVKIGQRSESNSFRLNPINIQMLSSGLHRQIFGQEQPNIVDDDTLNSVIAHLKVHGLWGRETSILPDVNIELPKLLGANIDEHFKIIGSRFSNGYKELLLQLSSCEIPTIPGSWHLTPGWTKYGADGSVKKVPFPEECALVFDVEVCMQEGNYPTLATAVSNKCWYLWCSDRLASNQFSWSQGITISDLIPLETFPGKIKPPKNKDWVTRLIVGHNVAFDRTFVKEQYLLEKTKLSFVDTMSFHVCVSGLTGLQRAMSAASKKKSINSTSSINMDLNGTPLGWSGISSLNSLADVYSLYCDGLVLEKEEREVFVTGTLADVKSHFQELATYCARDVKATHMVLKKITPLFFERFPHPITFAGLLEMSSAYLPINQNWECYLRDAEDTYADLQKELKLSLIHLANDACCLLHDNAYKNDPWLWDLDWSVQEIKFRKMPSSPPKKQKVKVKVATEIKEDESEETFMSNEIEEDYEASQETENSENDLSPTIKLIFESAAALRKIRPFLPGYPSWYRELCDKTSHVPDDDWEPGPNLISSQMRCVPKLMHLMWDGFPLHYDTKHGWGYLVPDLSVEEFCDQIFPVKNLHEIIFQSKHKTKGSDLPSIQDQNHPSVHSIEKNHVHICGSKIPNKPLDHYGIGPYDIGIKGCLFYRMPHKDGPQKRVGNPLSKDFLSKVEDGTLSSWGKGQADRALLLSKMLSYWKNSHNRILSQMSVWLNHEELPSTLIENLSFDDSNKYGAILPRLIPAGTVTRRAVEPTWLTASNAYEDRVGSELKSMIQAPPGYHFVGADVDSQELWIAALLGDSNFVKIHGCTAFGWMTLQGKRVECTDMHSRTAESVGITRNQAKVLNYARIYGAGKAFAQRLLIQFNHRFTPEDAKVKVKKIYAETKGTRKISDIYADNEEVVVYNSDLKSPHRRAWVGGSESHMFNKLEEIALSPKPQTPVLSCRISRALEPDAVDKNFMTSRVNWVVQSSAVDYLHLMLVCMKWLLEEYDINGRFCICIHDEVRYLVKSDDRYRAALALHLTNLFTRSFFAYSLGMKDLPQSVAFFSSVDIDHVLRKEVTMDAVTPSNPHGLKKRYGIPEGEGLDIFQTIEKTAGSLNKNHVQSNSDEKSGDVML